jgi:hypothetical protein
LLAQWPTAPALRPFLSRFIACAAQQELTQLDAKLYLQVFATPNPPPEKPLDSPTEELTDESSIAPVY